MTDPVTPSMPPVQNNQEITDAEHLNLLKIFHYVVGGLECLGICFGSMYMFLGAAAMSGMGHAARSDDKVFGLFLLIFGFFMAILPLILGICTIISGKMIAARKGRTFSLIVAGVNCIVFPIGTALGVFTMIVMMRDSVRRLYEKIG